MAKVDLVAEKNKVKKMIRKMLDESEFHYVSVRNALRELMADYEKENDVYAKASEMKEFTKVHCVFEKHTDEATAEQLVNGQTGE